MACAAMCLFGQSKRLSAFLTLFVSLTWLSALIYFLLGQFLRQNALITKQPVPYDPASAGSLIEENAVPDSAISKHEDLLARLGFVRTPALYPQPHHAPESQLPIFVVAVGEADVKDFYKFIGSMRMFYAEKKLVVYDLGMSADDVNWVRVTCQCLVRVFHWELYPDHIRDTRTQAYKPLLIQDALQEFGVVFWCSVRMRFLSPQLAPVVSIAKTYGLATWVSQAYPTSSLTHYGTFRYLQTRQSDYYFHHMADPDQAIFVNYNTIHRSLMLPWVTCALETACMAPPGAQFGGCDYSRRPRFVYSGCHRYAVSAYNVLLGRMFGMETPYLSNHTVHTMATDSLTSDVTQQTGWLYAIAKHFHS